MKKKQWKYVGKKVEKLKYGEKSFLSNSTLQYLWIKYVHISRGRRKHVTWRKAQSWAVNSDNKFVFKIRALHCTPLEFRTAILAGGFWFESTFHTYLEPRAYHTHMWYQLPFLYREASRQFAHPLVARFVVLDRGGQIGGLLWSADFPPQRVHLFPPRLLSKNEA